MFLHNLERFDARLARETRGLRAKFRQIALCRRGVGRALRYGWSAAKAG